MAQELIELQTTGDCRSLLDRRASKLTIAECSDPLRVGEQRLEIYSHAIEIFISRLSTYQPLLSSIHKEYDSMIGLLQTKVLRCSSECVF